MIVGKPSRQISNKKRNKLFCMLQNEKTQYNQTTLRAKSNLFPPFLPLCPCFLDPPCKVCTEALILTCSAVVFDETVQAARCLGWTLPPHLADSLTFP